jgi:GT2 family glycosyltransferase
LLEELLLYKVLPKARTADLLLGGYWDHGEEREVDWITGACMVVRRAVFEETGGFDPAMFLYGEEVEWCHRIRARGWGVLFSPVGEVRHLGHASADQLLGEQGRIDQCLMAADRLMRRWHGRGGGAMAPVIRIAGAVLKLTVFSFRTLHRRDEHYAREVKRGCKMVLGHYARRVVGQIRTAG